MAVTANSAVSPQTPKLGLVQIANADASNLKTVLTGGSNGTKVTSLALASSDTTARDIQWGVSRSATFYPYGTVTVPINAGSIAATIGIDAFSAAVTPGLPIDSDGQPYVFLENGDTLDIKSLTTVTAAKAVSAKATAGNF